MRLVAYRPTTWASGRLVDVRYCNHARRISYVLSGPAVPRPRASPTRVHSPAAGLGVLGLGDGQVCVGDLTVDNTSINCPSPYARAPRLG
jgi:hypothetical protein